MKLNEHLQSLVDSIVIAMETPETWQKCWKTNLAFPVRHTGEYYQGINILLLWRSKAMNGFNSNVWLTFKQASELKAKVKAGSKGSHIFYYSTFKRIDDETGDESAIPFLKGYVVFNGDQIEGLPENIKKLGETKPIVGNGGKKIDCAEQLIKNTGAKINAGLDAYYSPAIDSITMPSFESFDSSNDYYSTMFHELGHWTGHKSRLDRVLKGHNSKPEYALEELVAELCAIFTCNSLGIVAGASKNNVAYLQSWQKCLKDKPDSLIKAASMASKAMNFLQGKIENE